jgi:hypothetical protein
MPPGILQSAQRRTRPIGRTVDPMVLGSVQSLQQTTNRLENFAWGLLRLWNRCLRLFMLITRIFSITLFGSWGSSAPLELPRSVSDTIPGAPKDFFRQCVSYSRRDETCCATASSFENDLQSGGSPYTGLESLLIDGHIFAVVYDALHELPLITLQQTDCGARSTIDRGVAEISRNIFERAD